MHGTDQIDTGIIDQDVDPTSAAAYLFDAGLDRSVVSDIEQHELDAGERTSRRGGTDAAERPEAWAPAVRRLPGRCRTMHR
jgi:hypothetical protein